ncbi:hypothetical protein CDAR_374101 [Caerostris darwini]|uniref:Uncharacterized protein n=1 Tax=Caerostris darwini TaxID=1538125 RepID=A0AAV4P1J1_9ARAC|nr:hypothetical protein CDAR_374101 [Caerostris darwini]
MAEDSKIKLLVEQLVPKLDFMLQVRTEDIVLRDASGEITKDFISILSKAIWRKVRFDKAPWMEYCRTYGFRFKDSPSQYVLYTVHACVVTMGYHRNTFECFLEVYATLYSIVVTFIVAHHSNFVKYTSTICTVLFDSLLKERFNKRCDFPSFHKYLKDKNYDKEYDELNRNFTICGIKGDQIVTANFSGDYIKALDYALPSELVESNLRSIKLKGKVLLSFSELSLEEVQSLGRNLEDYSKYRIKNSVGEEWELQRFQRGYLVSLAPESDFFSPNSTKKRETILTRELKGMSHDFSLDTSPGSDGIAKKCLIKFRGRSELSRIVDHTLKHLFLKVDILIKTLENMAQNV